MFEWQWSDERKDDGLRAAQRAAGLARADHEIRYENAWLHEPTTPSAAGQAILDKRAAEAAEREAKHLQEQESAAQRRAAGLAAAETARTFQLNARSSPTKLNQGETLHVAALADAPLPWRMRWDGAVLAADGSAVITGNPQLNGTRSEARMRVMIVAVNTAVGLATPEDEAKPAPETPTEADFLEAMAAVITDRRPDLTPPVPDELAARILADFLTDNGVAYGEDGFDWTHDGAVELVDEALAEEDAQGPVGDAGDDQDEAA
jgi:hypothetical protein